MAATQSYRVDFKNQIESSSEEGELSSDGEDTGVKTSEKSLKNVETMDVINSTEAEPTSANPRQHQRKRNNIWGSVLADQSSEDISNSIGVVGMKNYLSRGPESFSLAAFKDKHREMETSSSDDEAPSKTRRRETIEEEMENYMIERHYLNQKQSTKSFRNHKLKRKRPKKSKPGCVPTYQPGQRITLNKKHEICANDSEDIVAEEIIFRLWEKKKDLIKALVRCIGVPKALLLYGKTEAIEMNGGLMTRQGNRRRTPGGTFLFLLRSDTDINQEEVNKIFEADFLRDREHWLAVKQAKKQTKEPSVDVGQTPQNSPQMDTLHLDNEIAASTEQSEENEHLMDDIVPNCVSNTASFTNEDLGKTGVFG